MNGPEAAREETLNLVLQAAMTKRAGNPLLRGGAGGDFHWADEGYCCVSVPVGAP